MLEMILLALGMKCPKPLFEVSRNMKRLEIGQVLVVHADDPAFSPDIEAWCRRTGNELIALTQEPDRVIARVRRVQ